MKRYTQTIELGVWKFTEEDYDTWIIARNKQQAEQHFLKEQTSHYDVRRVRNLDLLTFWDKHEEGNYKSTVSAREFIKKYKGPIPGILGCSVV